MKKLTNLDDPKTRIRTSEELESRKKCFLEICNILDRLDVFYFIQGGTLLAARRDKKFIEWDWDVEISVYDNDLSKIFDELIKELSLENFSIVKCNKFFNAKIDCYKEFDHETTSFTIMAWSYDKNKNRYFRGKINIPEKFLNKGGQIYFYEKKFNTPSPIDDYLAYQYGDWKIRKRTSNKELYMTNQFYNRDSFVIKIIKYIYIKIRLLF